MAIFSKILKIIKRVNCILSVVFYVKNGKYRFRTKIMKFLGIQPIYRYDGNINMSL